MSNKPITVEQASMPCLSDPFDAPIEYDLEKAQAYLRGYNDGAKAGAKWKEQQMEEERKKIIDAIEEALPYVIGAYECAFPDEDKNSYVARLLNTLLTKYNSK